MKKKLMVLVISFILLISTACTLGNTPTSATERLLYKYNINDQEILTELDDYVNDSTLTEDQSEKYKNIYLKQFKDMKYEIKEEKIDGNTATVTVQITVYDFYSAEREANEYLTNNPDEFKSNDEYDESLFMDYKLKKLDEVNKTVDYTIDFTLTKVDNEWVLNDLTREQLEKIHGVYVY